MKKYYCDRCGKEIKVDRYIPKNHTEQYFYNNKGKYESIKNDYCSACYKLIQSTFKKLFSGEMK